MWVLVSSQVLKIMSVHSKEIAESYKKWWITKENERHATTN